MCHLLKLCNLRQILLRIASLSHHPEPGLSDAASLAEVAHLIYAVVFSIAARSPGIPASHREPEQKALLPLTKCAVLISSAYTASFAQGCSTAVSYHASTQMAPNRASVSTDGWLDGWQDRGMDGQGDGQGNGQGDGWLQGWLVGCMGN